mmetsp:Transcript_20830/g.45103  ORF Transcript_20830/g.45103 Transcript_20830/m.45103 type:complete len:1545 (+) Transcript_20830:73-4707(+)
MPTILLSYGGDVSGDRADNSAASAIGGVGAGKTTGVDGTSPSRCDEERITIRTRDPLGEELSIRMKLDTKMKLVMRVFARRKGLDVNRVRFLLDGGRICDDDTPRSLELNDQDIIDVWPELAGPEETEYAIAHGMMRVDGRFTVIIRVSDDFDEDERDNIICYVSQDTTIHELKIMLEYYHGILLEKTRLVFNGKNLQEGTLKEHGITKSSKIKLFAVDDVDVAANQPRQQQEEEGKMDINDESVSPMDTNTAQQPTKSTIDADDSCEEALKSKPVGTEEATSKPSHSGEATTSATEAQQDWHMEILAGLFLRSSKDELDWLERQAVGGVRTTFDASLMGKTTETQSIAKSTAALDKNVVPTEKKKSLQPLEVLTASVLSKGKHSSLLSLIPSALCDAGLQFDKWKESATQVGTVEVDQVVNGDGLGDINTSTEGGETNKKRAGESYGGEKVATDAHLKESADQRAESIRETNSTEVEKSAIDASEGKPSAIDVDVSCDTTTHNSGLIREGGGKEEDADDFNHPLRIPNAWTRSSYISSSLPELEQRIVTVVKSAGGIVGDSKLFGALSNGKSNIPTTDEKQKDDNSSKEYDMFTLLYNECSLAAMANWAMIDFPTDTLNTTTVLHGGTEDSNNSVTPDTNEDWETFKQESTKKLSIVSSRYNYTVPPLNFRMCGVCGKFGHYEVECNLLVETGKRGREGGDGDDCAVKKEKINTVDEKVALNKEERKTVVSTLAREIRVQRLMQGFMEETMAEKRCKNEEMRVHATMNAALLTEIDSDLSQGGLEQQSEFTTTIPAMFTGSVTNKPAEVEDKNVEFTGKNSCCSVCNCGLKGEDMLVCDGCDYLFHFKCLDPPLNDVPEGEWFCDACLSYDSDVSSTVVIEGCGDFVFEQRKRSVAEEDTKYGGVSLGQHKSRWTTAIAWMNENTPLVGDKEYLQLHIDRQDDERDETQYVLGELCWAKKPEWWPGMVISMDSRQDKSFYTVQLFTLEETTEVSAPDILPFLPFYEDIGHKSLVHCDNLGHEQFRIALELCTSTLGLKSLGQVLRHARDVVQKTLSVGEHRSTPVARRLKSSGWRPPAGWGDAEVDEVDGIMILSKGSSAKSRDLGSPGNTKSSGVCIAPTPTSNTESVSTTPVDEAKVNSNLQLVDSRPTKRVKMEFQLDEILGGIVSWEWDRECAEGIEQSRNVGYGVLISLNPASEMALVRSIPMLSNGSSGNLDALFRELSQHGSNVSKIRANDLGSTIWMSTRYLRFVSGNPNSSDLLEFRDRLTSSMKSEMQSYQSRCKKAARQREQTMVELGSSNTTRALPLDSLEREDVVHRLSSDAASSFSTQGHARRNSSGGEIFHVESILDKRRNPVTNEGEYLVKWRDYNEAHNTWEPAKSFDSNHAIQLFESGRLLAQLKETVEANDDKSLTYQMIQAIEAGRDKLEKGIVDATVPVLICPYCDFTTHRSASSSNHVKKHSRQPNFELIRQCLKRCDPIWFSSLGGYDGGGSRTEQNETSPSAAQLPQSQSVSEVQVQPSGEESKSIKGPSLSDCYCDGS